MTTAAAAESQNRIAPSRSAAATSRRVGDVPEALLSRYLVEREPLARKAAFYRDHRETAPRFIDRGRSLSADNAYPDAVRDMLQIARHRGWTGIRVQGDLTFRREVWLQGQALGLDVRGHRPSSRDRQAEAQARPNAAKTPNKRRYDQAAVIVRGLIADPAAQARLLSRAWAHVTRDAERTRSRDREPSR